MKHLIEMKKKLIQCAEEHMEDLCAVDTEELGVVIDMIKDLEEGIFYCIMGHHQLEKDEAAKVALHHCCHCDGMDEVDFLDDDHNPTFMKKEHMAATYDHHELEGHSYLKRKAYLEAKEHKKDKIVQMKELEEYMKELSIDMTDMIKDASLEERQLLEKRLQALATKIASIDDK